MILSARYLRHKRFLQVPHDQLKRADERRNPRLCKWTYETIKEEWLRSLLYVQITDTFSFTIKKSSSSSLSSTSICAPAFRESERRTGEVMGIWALFHLTIRERKGGSQEETVIAWSSKATLTKLNKNSLYFNVVDGKCRRYFFIVSFYYKGVFQLS